MRNLAKRLLSLAVMCSSLLATTALAQQFGAEDKPAPLAADTLLLNAKVLTPGGWSGGLAIKGSTIVAIGDEAALKPYRGDATRVIDLKGATVLPGLYDMHVHPIIAGTEKMGCNFPQDATPVAIAEAVRSCVARKPTGAWISGGLWVRDAFGKMPPNRAMLDKVAPANPVMLEESTHHTIWLNSAGLKAVGISRRTPNAKGFIDVDKNGEPTGLLREGAAEVVRAQVPPPSAEELVAALDWATREMLAQGITGFEEALLTTPGARAYAALADSGKLVQHVRACMWDRDQALIAYRDLYRRPNFDPACVKFLLDGVPNSGHTGAMTAPYADAATITDPKYKQGFLMIQPEVLVRAVTRYDAMGLGVKVHATGDGAVDAALGAFEAARKANGAWGMRHEIAHDNFVLASDIARAGRIGATLEFSPYVWYPSPPMADVARVTGPERMARFSPVREALAVGVTTIAGSDWPVTPSVSPWTGIETLVTRQAPGGVGPSVAPQEKISVAQAVDIFTRQAARQMGTEDRTGTIETGKQADLVVIDRDIFTIAPGEIHNTRVLRTIIGGKEVYTAP